MKNLTTFNSFMNEGKEEWDDVDLSPEGLVDLRVELEYEANGPLKVAEVDGITDEYKELSDEENRNAVAEILKCEATDEAITAALKAQYPQGYILHDNNDFHQWGGELDDDDMENEYDEDEAH